MSCTARQLSGFDVRAYDGRVGTVHDLYFDDEDWSICFVVVRVGRWPFGRRLLISPSELRMADEEEEVLSIALRRSQLNACPEAHVHRPVSSLRREEQSASRGWLPVWPCRAPFGAYPVPALALLPMDDEGEEGEWGGTSPRMDKDEVDVHLRSMSEVIGYHIQAIDGEIGHVEDLLLCDKDWLVRYVIVDTRNWWGGRKVLVEPQWIEEFRCGESKVYLKLARGGVEGIPQYDPDLY
jgi:hypothetical protein